MVSSKAADTWECRRQKKKISFRSSNTDAKLNVYRSFNIRKHFIFTANTNSKCIKMLGTVCW